LGGCRGKGSQSVYAQLREGYFQIVGRIAEGYDSLVSAAVGELHNINDVVRGNVFFGGFAGFGFMGGFD
jgi:hypothetical protein